VSEARAVLFDLDDTLYPRRSFVLSGFRAVAGQLERDHAIPAAAAFKALRHACDHGSRGRELQEVCRLFALPMSIVPALIDVVRGHVPSIRLPRRSVRVLRSLGPTWRIGVLTNGLPGVQKRKVAALGIEPLVDAVVYAAECGEDSEKPATAGFVAVLQRLGAPADTAVFVGDDPRTDIASASRLGIRTIHVSASTEQAGGDVPASARVSSLSQVPAVAERLVPRKGAPDAV
jgi:putative hydrolase of the HAD superfamily